MQRQFDREESPAQLRGAIELVERTHDRFRALPDQLEPPAEGSMLDLERAHTLREPIDTVAMSQRARAMENADRALSMMVDQQEGRLNAFPFSFYSLIRPAVESAATAVWMLKPSKKKDRVLRCLQVSYRNATDALRFAELLLGRSGSRPARERTDQILVRLNELKDTVGPLRQVTLGPPPRYSKIMASVSPYGPNRQSGNEISSPLVVWSMCSAFLHGSEQVVRALSDIRQLGEFTDGIASFMVTPRLQAQAICLRTCVDLIEQLDNRYRYLASHDYAGRAMSDNY